MNNLPIDLMIRIKNGYLARKEVITGPFSKMNLAILEKLKKFGFIKDFNVKEEKNKREIEIILNYDKGENVFTDIKIYSKPGRRWYVSYKELKPVMGGMGISILSTSKGILTDKESKKLKIGGELLFSIW